MLGFTDTLFLQTIFQDMAWMIIFLLFLTIINLIILAKIAKNTRESSKNIEKILFGVLEYLKEKNKNP